jgi:hypothetical protein
MLFLGTVVAALDDVHSIIDAGPIEARLTRC